MQEKTSAAVLAWLDRRGLVCALRPLHLPPRPRGKQFLIRSQTPAGRLGLALMQPPRVAKGEHAKPVIHPDEAPTDEHILNDQYIPQKDDDAHLPPVALALLRRFDLDGLAVEDAGGEPSRSHGSALLTF